jgi:hypothetical protein
MPPATPVSVRTALIERVTEFTTDAELASQFHYRTVTEKSCLEAVQKTLNNTKSSLVAAAQKQFDSDLAAHKSNFPDDTEFVARVMRTVAESDTKSMWALETEMGREVDNFDLDNMPPKTNSRDKVVSAAKGLFEANTTTQKALPIIAAAVDMDARTWRARHLAYLEREIDKAQLYLLRNPALGGANAAAVQAYALTLRRERAETIGALELYDRSLALSRFLQTVRNKSVEGGRAPATTEYAAARAELDAVLTQIEARRAATIADGKPASPPPPPAFKPVQVKRVTTKEMKAMLEKDWFAKNGPQAPNYVLVLEEAK